MRKQDEQAIEFIGSIWGKKEFWEKKFGKSLRVLCWKNAFKIYYYDTCIVSYSWISHDVIFNSGGWETVSTAQHLKAFVEEIFRYKRLPRWKGIKDEYDQIYEWYPYEIHIEHVKCLYL
jgi:hypothetical protein